jgi:recombination protein RecR
MHFPTPLQKLIDQFCQLPSVGPKTAERYALHLLKQPPEKLQEFAQYLAELKEKIIICQNCLSISETNPCQICSNKNRNNKLLCIVENSSDLLAIEHTRQFSGNYFVLGGLINTIEGIKPENLNFNLLLAKIRKSKEIKELILALNSTIEGETTSMYIVKILKNSDLKITRLAKGMPTGSSLEYADDLTISNALKYRNELN